MPEQAPQIAQVSAWAKLNLDLRILAREDNGYHQLETVFQRISLADAVEVRVHDGAGIALTCDMPLDVSEERNLAFRAAAAYRHAAAWPPLHRAIHITLAKQIPTGGGLGGGSADAGAVLRALNALNPAPLDSDALLTIAAGLGADVPFLASESVRALAWGRGERMFDLDPLPQRRVHFATFRDGVNTAVAYRELAAARADGRVMPVGSAMLDRRALGAWSDLTRVARNDFEVPVFAMRPDISAVHASLQAAAPGALVRMSGSGATVFAISDTHAQALHAAARSWPGDGAVSLRQASTLETLPPVAILSAPSGPR